MKQRSKTLYFVYEDDSLIASGTVEQCAKDLGVSRSSIIHYGSPQQQQRFKAGLARRIAVRAGREKQDEI